MQPLPPSPPLIRILASSANMECPSRRNKSAIREGPKDAQAWRERVRHKTSAEVQGSLIRCGRLIRNRKNADHAAMLAAVRQQHDAVNPREKRIVLCAAH